MFENAGDEHKMVIDIGDERRELKKTENRLKDKLKGIEQRFGSYEMIKYEFDINNQQEKAIFQLIAVIMKKIKENQEVRVIVVEPCNQIYHVNVCKTSSGFGSDEYLKKFKKINLYFFYFVAKIREITINRQNIWLIKVNDDILYKTTDNESVILERNPYISFEKCINKEYFKAQIDKLKYSESLWICDWNKELIYFALESQNNNLISLTKIYWNKIKNVTDWELAAQILSWSTNSELMIQNKDNININYIMNYSFDKKKRILLNHGDALILNNYLYFRVHIKFEMLVIEYKEIDYRDLTSYSILIKDIWLIYGKGIKVMEEDQVLFKIPQKYNEKIK